MRWWARRPLRTKIFLPFSLLILATLLSTLWLISSMASRQIENRVRRELLVSGRVLHNLVADRTQRLMVDTSLLATDFALKQVIATYDANTLATVAANYRDRIGVDVLWITDERGARLASSAGGAEAASAAVVPPLADALGSRKGAAAVAELNGRLMQLAAVPVLAPDPIAFLVAGKAIDDETARRLQADTESRGVLPDPRYGVRVFVAGRRARAAGATGRSPACGDRRTHARRRLRHHARP